MKKIKLLFATSLVALSLPQVIAMTSCGDKGDETKHVTTEVKTEPEVGKKFEFTFKLDDNYSLNVGESNIQFGSESNALETVSLSKCTIDSNTKTVTVPAEYVTSTQYKMNIVSEKQAKITDQTELKKVVAEFLKSETNKDITYEGDINIKWWNGDIDTDPSTWTTKQYQKGKYTYLLKNKDIKTITKLTTYNPEGEITTPEVTTEKYDIADANGIGFWCLYINPTAKDAYPSPYGGLQNQISEFFSFDPYIEGLKYDSSRNAYDGTIFESGKNKIAFNFYLSKDKKSVKAFEITEYAGMSAGQGQKMVIDSRAYCPAKDQGKTTFEKPAEAEWNKHNVYGSGQIVYSQETGKYVYHISGSNFTPNTRIEIKLDKFDSTKKTYIKINSGVQTTIYKHADDVLYLGNTKLIKGTDWNVGLDEGDGLYYIEINNIDPSKTLYCVSNPTAVINTNFNEINEGIDAITIYQ